MIAGGCRDVEGRRPGSRTPSRATARPRGPDRSQKGFTLVELLIVVAIMPMIVGALGLGLMSMFSLQNSVSSRLANTGDAQAVGVNYRNDVQSAKQITTFSSITPQCGTGNLVLGLEWDLITNPQDPNVGQYQTVVSYDLVPLPSGKVSLVRNYCVNQTSTPQTSTTLSYNIGSAAGSAVVVLSPTAAATSSATGWVDATTVDTVSFALTEPEGTNNSTPFRYTLVASPASSATASNTGGPITTTTTTSCNHAAVGGTYASTLCLVDFSPLNIAANYNAATAPNGCLEISVDVGNGNTLFFCIHLSGGLVSAVALPTYGQAFLGNSLGGSPFYIGVPGNPALYQPFGHNGEAPTVVTITNIAVVNNQGVNATGWDAVAADAETSDAGESIYFSSDQKLNLLYNSPTSAVGNACGQTAGQPIVTSTLSGIGTNTIKCIPPSNETSATKTGTAMVWASTPSSMTITLNGGAGGLEGMAFGLLLS